MQQDVKLNRESDMWLNLAPKVLTEKQIKTIEKHYGVVYVGCFTRPNSDIWESMFYQKNPKTELGHSHVMSMMYISQDLSELIFHEPGFFVRDGKWVEGESFCATVVDGSEIVVSCGVHNHRAVPLGFIDGGSAYFRASGNINVIGVKINIKALGEYALANPNISYDAFRFKGFDYRPYLTSGE